MTQLTNDITDLTVVCSKCGNEFNPGDDNTFFDLEDDYAECRLCPKPIIQNFDKTVVNIENGREYDYDDFIRDNGDIFLDGMELNMEEFITEVETIADDLIIEFEDHFDATVEELKNGVVDFEDIYQFMQNEQLFDTTGNSYNWGYFGPTYNFGTIGADPYSSIGLVRFHRGGDVRGNYGKARACFGKVLYGHDFELMISLETDKGKYQLRSRDLEAYYFELYNTEENYCEYQEESLDNIGEFFNMEDSEYSRLDSMIW